jgi:hypothetical protein
LLFAEEAVDTPIRSRANGAWWLALVSMLCCATLSAAAAPADELHHPPDHLAYLREAGAQWLYVRPSLGVVDTALDSERLINHNQAFGDQ